MTNPAPKKIRTSQTVHGYLLEDDYAWLREKENPEVRAYLESENRLSEEWLSAHRGEVDKVYEELLSRIQETDYSAPEKEGKYYYYLRTVKGGQYPIYCRAESESMENELVLLDGNAESKGKTFFDIGCIEVSRCDRYLCYGIDEDGSEEYLLQIKDLQNGRLMAEQITCAGTSVEWTESSGFYYTKLSSTKRPYQVYYHKLGTTQKQDALIYEENDEAYFVDLNRTKDRQFIIIESVSKTTSECRILPCGEVSLEPRLFQKRIEGVEYSIDRRDDFFYILTNHEATNFRIVKTPENLTSIENWSDVLGHEPEIKIEDMDVFRDYIVIYERRNGLDAIRIYQFITGEIRVIGFDEEAYSIQTHENYTYDAECFRYSYSSPVTPSSTIDYYFADGRRELKKQKKVSGNFTSDDYAVRRIWAVSDDGEKIPMTVVGRKDVFRKGKAPVYLYGYGSYGISVDPVFSSNRVSLLDRGVLFGIAHIRGGGEMGRKWYDEGKTIHKENTFNDFLSCARKLIESGLTEAGRIFISGGSAGGLLVGTALNRMPHYYAGAILDVPFVDVMNTMLDDTLPLTVTEYDEWGNPSNKDDFFRILAYSPYENIRKQKYPPVFVTGGWNDSRVQYWEPAKWVAKLREFKTDHNPVYLLTNFESGHGGPSGRYDFLKEVARDYVFCLTCVGKSV